MPSISAAAINSVQTDILIGSASSSATCFCSSFNVRARLFPASPSPSLLAAILVLQQFSIGLNTMLLSGLPIALGEVVDDAIMELGKHFPSLRENCLLPVPAPLQELVFQTCMEVCSSMVYATFIVALVFLPYSPSRVAGKMLRRSGCPTSWHHALTGHHAAPGSFEKQPSRMQEPVAQLPGFSVE